MEDIILNAQEVIAFLNRIDGYSLMISYVRKKTHALCNRRRMTYGRRAV